MAGKTDDEQKGPAMERPAGRPLHTRASRADRAYAFARWLAQLFAVLQPSMLFSALIIYLPLTGIGAPGASMLGNMFVDFTEFDGLWYGLALFAATWTNMLTLCLTLDGERDRPDRWINDLGARTRKATIPIPNARVFAAFTALALPGAIVVVSQAESPWKVLGGLLLGGVLAYLLLDFSVMLLATVAASKLDVWGKYRGLLAYTMKVRQRLSQYAESPSQQEHAFEVLPWKPLFARIGLGKEIGESAMGQAAQGFYEVANWLIGELIRRKGRLMTGDDENDRRLDHRHVHLLALWNLVAVSLLYFSAYLQLRNEKNWATGIPAVVYVYVLLLPLMWAGSALWYHLGRYRLVLLALVLSQVGFNWVGSWKFVETRWGGPNNTYDLQLAPAAAALAPADVVGKLAMPATEQGDKPNLIVIATSGGGILAAGWTATVLGALHASYPRFGTELRLISAVSGGSVGTAHYLSVLEDHVADASADELKTIYERATSSSLTASAYGLAFPDFRRAILPIGTHDLTDRGRLLENYWREMSRASPDTADKTRLLSGLREDVRQGRRPAVIFNATVMETGERVVITPISTLRDDWYGYKEQWSYRRHHARTFPEFLDGIARVDLKDQRVQNWDLDLWTAARISATFPYVSPAPRAALADQDPHPPKNARFHLVDGGYHDNSGVASALDFLALALKGARGPDRTFDRVALIEIRARPSNDDSIPAGAFEASWLGPAVGLFQSWSTAQTMTCDTAVNRLIASLSAELNSQGSPFESFVFSPVEEGPTSWHLSRSQKQIFCRSWQSSANQEELTRFLTFLAAKPGTTASGPACESTSASPSLAKR